MRRRSNLGQPYVLLASAVFGLPLSMQHPWSGDNGKCPKCFMVTCTICKGASHAGDCQQDTSTQQVLQLATEQGWRRCSNCRRTIDLKLGCNHIHYVSIPSSTSDFLLILEVVLAKQSAATFVE